MEDCLVLDECLGKTNDGKDLSEAVKTFAELRRPACNAIAQLSLDNYVEMRHKTASSLFLLRARLEALLHYLAYVWLLYKVVFKILHFSRFFSFLSLLS